MSKAKDINTSAHAGINVDSIIRSGIGAFLLSTSVEKVNGIAFPLFPQPSVHTSLRVLNIKVFLMLLNQPSVYECPTRLESLFSLEK